MKLDEIAKRIAAHLETAEADKEWNSRAYTDRDGVERNLRKFYMSRAWRAGSRVGVVYVSYQDAHNLTKQEALDYLAWLDAGNRGTHLGMSA